MTRLPARRFSSRCRRRRVSQNTRVTVEHGISWEGMGVNGPAWTRLEQRCLCGAAKSPSGSAGKEPDSSRTGTQSHESAPVAVCRQQDWRRSRKPLVLLLFQDSAMEQNKKRSNRQHLRRGARRCPVINEQANGSAAPSEWRSKRKRQTACKPGSVPASRRAMAIHLGRPLPDASCDRPGRRRGNALRRRDAGMPSLLGLAPGGVYRAVAVAGDAVRSYRTLSPLPAGARRTSRPGRRFAFCGTVPGVAPAGRYPAPCFRGARTFLPRRARTRREAAIRPSGYPHSKPARRRFKPRGRVPSPHPRRAKRPWPPLPRTKSASRPGGGRSRSRCGR